MPTTAFDLQEIILGQSLEAHFQPIVSLRKRTISGYEGLSKTTFITEPYLSLVTGNICITFARLFQNLETKQHFIICTDINTE